MEMKNDEKVSSFWAKHSEYEYKKGNDGTLYLTPTQESKVSVYDPMADIENLIVDALNVGRLAMKNTDDNEMKKAVLNFVSKYGLLGLMTALPTTPHFIDYDAVYLMKNHFIYDEAMSTQDYMSLFFPFGKPDFYKDKRTAVWNVRGEPELLALAHTFSNEPMTMNISLTRSYAERYDWLVTKFKDWMFSFVSAILYYEDKDAADEETLNYYRSGIAAFHGIAPTYHIAFYDKPTIVWDFHSLLLSIQMMFSFALTDYSRPLRLCPQCNLAFFAKKPDDMFCSRKCKNKNAKENGK